MLIDIEWELLLLSIVVIVYISFAFSGLYFEKGYASISIKELDRICSKYSNNPFFNDMYGRQDEFLCLKEKIVKPIPAPFSGNVTYGRLQDLNGERI